MDVNGDGEVTEADFALWGPLFGQAWKRPNAVGAMVDDGPFNGVAEGGVLSVATELRRWRDTLRGEEDEYRRKGRQGDGGDACKN